MANIVELRDLSQEDLEDQLEDRRQELFNLRFQRATGRLEDYSRLKKVRAEIAQLLTVVTGRRQAIDAAIADPAIARVLKDKEWEATARFVYEESRHFVEFTEDGESLASAKVDLNRKRRGARRVRIERPAPQRVADIEVLG
jgi:large subunit ribosomal protein L29